MLRRAGVFLGHYYLYLAFWDPRQSLFSFILFLTRAPLQWSLSYLFSTTQPKSLIRESSAKLLNLSDISFKIAPKLSGESSFSLQVSLLFWDLTSRTDYFGLFHMPSDGFLKILSSFLSCSTGRFDLKQHRFCWEWHLLFNFWLNNKKKITKKNKPGTILTPALKLAVCSHEWL